MARVKDEDGKSVIPSPRGIAVRIVVAIVLAVIAALMLANLDAESGRLVESTHWPGQFWNGGGLALAILLLALGFAIGAIQAIRRRRKALRRRDERRAQYGRVLGRSSRGTKQD